MRTATGLTWDELRRLGAAIEEARSFSAEQRRSAAKSGAALSDGSYPIYTQKDADNAAKLVGHGNAADSTIIAHIRKRVKALGLTMPASLAGNSGNS